MLLQISNTPTNKMTRLGLKEGGNNLPTRTRDTMLLTTEPKDQGQLDRFSLTLDLPKILNMSATRNLTTIPKHGGKIEEYVILRRQIEDKKAEDEREKKRLEEEYYQEKEKERSPEPTPVGGIGSSQQELLQTLMELKCKVEGEVSACPREFSFSKRLEERAGKHT